MTDDPRSVSNVEKTLKYHRRLIYTFLKVFTFVVIHIKERIATLTRDYTSHKVFLDVSRGWCRYRFWYRESFATLKRRRCETHCRSPVRFCLKDIEEDLWISETVPIEMYVVSHFFFSNSDRFKTEFFFTEAEGSSLSQWISSLRIWKRKLQYHRLPYSSIGRSRSGDDAEWIECLTSDVSGVSEASWSSHWWQGLDLFPTSSRFSEASRRLPPSPLSLKDRSSYLERTLHSDGTQESDAVVYVLCADRDTPGDLSLSSWWHVVLQFCRVRQLSEAISFMRPRRWREDDNGHVSLSFFVRSSVCRISVW